MTTNYGNFGLLLSKSELQNQVQYRSPATYKYAMLRAMEGVKELLLIELPLFRRRSHLLDFPCNKAVGTRLLKMPAIEEKRIQH